MAELDFKLNLRIPVSEIPALSTKKVCFRPGIAVPMIAAGGDPLWGSRGMLPREKKLKICASKMPFPAF